MSATADDAPVSRPGGYFFLSYAHSAPPSDLARSDADPSVRTFFADLAAAVAARADPGTRLRPGFFDQQIPPGADLKAQLSEALGSAEVFVPLYSPGYFSKSWPMREQEVFRQRLSAASAVDPDRHIVPVLWTPFPAGQRPPLLNRARMVGGLVADYRENGLRALCMLASYRRSYERVLARLVDEIVTVAEGFPLGPSSAPDLDTVADLVPPDAGFVVAMLAPGKDVPPARVGGAVRTWWSSYAGRRIPPVVELAGSLAERLGMKTRIGDFADMRGLFARSPAIVLVDPWLVAARGPEFLTSIFAGLPDWVVPIVLDEPGRELAPAGADPEPVSAGPVRAAVTELKDLRGVAVNLVNSMDQLVDVLPAMVARARRTYLRHGPGGSGSGGSGSSGPGSSGSGSGGPGSGSGE